MVLSARGQIETALLDDKMVRLHWVDNFAKQYASNSMFFNRDLFKQCNWTAHAFKELPIAIDLSWKTIDGGDTVTALPNLDEILTALHFEDLIIDLIQFRKLSFMIPLLFFVMSDAFPSRW